MSQSNPPKKLPVSDAVWSRDLRPDGAPVDWLWRGYLARRQMTVLASQWKSGKTTLLAALLARMKAGGELAGLPVRAGKALVVTEEGLGHWRRRGDVFDFGDHVCWLSRPFLLAPTADDWRGLIVRLLTLYREHRFDLVAIDPLSAVFPGGDENNAGTMRKALLPLTLLAAGGPAVWVLHHTRKNVGRPGGAARGSGALPGMADILIEMHYYRSADDADRRRRLQAWSRFDDTPRQLVIERSDDGADFRSLGDLAAESFTDHWATLAAIFGRQTRKLTRPDVLLEWPEDRPKPELTTLWIWLERAVRDGLLKRSGKGHRNAPYRYWQPGREQPWWDDPFALPPLPNLDLLD